MNIHALDQEDKNRIEACQNKLHGKIVPVYIRFIAFGIDFFIKLILTVFLLLAIAKTNFDIPPLIIAILTGFIYESLFVCSNLKATPGKLFMGIVVVKNNGQKLNFIQAVYRFICRFFSVYILGIGVLAAANDILKRTIHCSLSKSYVIKPFGYNTEEQLILDKDL